MPGVTSQYLDTAEKLQAFSSNTRRALIYGFLAAVASVPCSYLLHLFAGLPFIATASAVASFSYIMTVLVMLHFGDGGPKVHRLDSVVAKLDEEIATLDEDLKRTKDLVGEEAKFRSLYALLEEKTAKRQRYMAMRTSIMERKNRITELEEEFDKMELRDLPEKTRQQEKTKARSRRK